MLLFTILLVLTATCAAPLPAAPASSSSDFHLQNGLDAQKLNTQFQTLTASSPCSEGEQACVGTSFAQCVSGSFALTPCASGTICAALPLVNKAGTSIACDTSSDIAARIAATGATNGATSSSQSTPAQNGLDAQKLNAKFTTLTAGSSCTDGEQACIGTAFAQCVSGSFVLTPCSGGTICAALPLVNKPGTSIACDTSADVQARITAAGVSGGITG
ncbi:hypothetical protein C8R43DRAFT_1087538 [Mycena crocata]|nr:hypothetical protein C8R43DRAFT_1087538 [Mycena crocata]